MPQVSQELGSIDQGKVEQTFNRLLNGPLEACHRQGRERLEVLAGDARVFLRIDSSGHARYAFFEETTIGDRETEQCLLSALTAAAWPKPEGGEAEIRNGFGWSPGDERAPTTWPSDKVTLALVDQAQIKKDIDRCRAGVRGDFHITGYVENDTGERATEVAKQAHKPTKNKPAAHAQGKEPKHAKHETGGRFKAVGIAAPSNDAAQKSECIVDALRTLELPSPGSYVAKVSFTL